MSSFLLVICSGHVIVKKYSIKVAAVESFDVDLATASVAHSCILWLVMPLLSWSFRGHFGLRWALLLTRLVGTHINLWTIGEPAVIARLTLTWTKDAQHSIMISHDLFTSQTRSTGHQTTPRWLTQETKECRMIPCCCRCHYHNTVQIQLFYSWA